MSGQYTKGGWEVRQTATGRDICHPVEPGDKVVAVIATVFGTEAEAYQMAAAPELYAELLLARDEVAETRSCIFESSTIGDDPKTLDEEAKPDIARLDTQLARIDAAIARASIPA